MRDYGACDLQGMGHRRMGLACETVTRGRTVRDIGRSGSTFAEGIRFVGFPLSVALSVKNPD